jgi:hypothetical protein
MPGPDVGFSEERLQDVFGLYHLARLDVDEITGDLAAASRQALAPSPVPG